MLRVAIATGFAFVLLASNAMAQGKMPKYTPDPEFKPLYNERDYKAATQRIPDAKPNNDPWAGARETPAPTAAPATTTTKPRARQP